MKIIVKLKPDELRAVCETLELCINNDVADTMHDALITMMILKIYKKMKEKSIMMEGPVRMQIPVEYAISFLEFFNYNVMPFSPSSFNGNVMHKLLSQFNQQTANLYQYY